MPSKGLCRFRFGGSTMWGWGEKDENTIPALLQQILSSELDCPVTVLNRVSRVGKHPGAASASFSASGRANA
jgi:hypothetical protein